MVPVMQMHHAEIQKDRTPADAMQVSMGTELIAKVWQAFT